MIAGMSKRAMVLVLVLGFAVVTVAARQAATPGQANATLSPAARWLRAVDGWEAGSYRALFELDSYGAMDAVAAAGKDPDSDFGRLMREVSQYFDSDLAAPWSNTLMKDVNDATIWDPR